jgi:DNA-directed RNA polymerase specialized sigma24 family protein
MPDEVDPETKRRYQAAFSNLPWVQQEIFWLHRIDGLSYAEIGWLLRVNVRFVERQIAKAIYKIGKQMDGGKLTCWERLF